jgi:hypothetical protein
MVGEEGGQCKGRRTVVLDAESSEVQTKAAGVGNVGVEWYVGKGEGKGRGFCSCVLWGGSGCTDGVGWRGR